MFEQVLRRQLEYFVLTAETMMLHNRKLINFYIHVDNELKVYFNDVEINWR